MSSSWDDESYADYEWPNDERRYIFETTGIEPTAFLTRHEADKTPFAYRDPTQPPETGW